VIPGAVMAAEMAEQPGRLAALLSRAEGIAGQVRQVLPDLLAGTVLIARGSSDHAATTGRYLLEADPATPVPSSPRGLRRSPGMEPSSSPMTWRSCCPPLASATVSPSWPAPDPTMPERGQGRLDGQPPAGPVPDPFRTGSAGRW
jgi:hypothetical protein